MAQSTSDFIADAEHLAQKVMKQCNTSSSPYRSMVGPLRNLRNALGDIDASHTEKAIDDAQVLQCVSTCRTLLFGLEDSIVSNITETRPSDAILHSLQSSFEMATKQLNAAHEAAVSQPEAPSPSRSSPRSSPSITESNGPASDHGDGKKTHVLSQVFHSESYQNGSVAWDFMTRETDWNDFNAPILDIQGHSNGPSVQTQEHSRRSSSEVPSSVHPAERSKRGSVASTNRPYPVFLSDMSPWPSPSLHGPMHHISSQHMISSSKSSPNLAHHHKMRSFSGTTFLGTPPPPPVPEKPEGFPWSTSYHKSVIYETPRAASPPVREIPTNGLGTPLTEPIIEHVPSNHSRGPTSAHGPTDRRGSTAPGRQGSLTQLLTQVDDALSRVVIHEERSASFEQPREDIPHERGRAHWPLPDSPPASHQPTSSSENVASHHSPERRTGRKRFSFAADQDSLQPGRAESERELHSPVRARARSELRFSGKDRVSRLQQHSQDSTSHGSSRRRDSSAPPGTPSDQQHIQHAVYFWNQRLWSLAETHLRSYLDSLLKGEDHEAQVRRVKHLLGVCSSFQGKWEAAIRYFLSVLRIPIVDMMQLDEADGAAAWWLADAYAMLNRRQEAWLAYSLAEHAPMFKPKASRALWQVIDAEKKRVMAGLSTEDFDSIWEKYKINSESLKGSILHPSVVISDTVTQCFKARFNSLPAKQLLRPDQNRAECLLNARVPDMATDTSAILWCNHTNPERLRPSHFLSRSPWPLPFDPFFTMANVQRGRFIAHEATPGDISHSRRSSEDLGGRKKFRRSIPILENYCLVSESLPQLVSALRDTLRTLEIAYIEEPDAQAMAFRCRYAQMVRGIATTYYFSLVVSRGITAKYGVKIAPDGLCAARLVGTYSPAEHERGVPISEKATLKKLVRETFDRALKARRRASDGFAGGSAGASMVSLALAVTSSTEATILKGAESKEVAV